VDPGRALDAGVGTGVDAAAEASLVCNVAPSSDSLDSLTIATDRGLVHGTTSGGADAYLGIPFSTPPLGPRRFAPPDEGACWSGVRDATKAGPECLQGTLIGTAGSEDCLTLNIWTPSSRPPNASLPVLVYVHDGGNAIGSADVPNNLPATQNVVLVAVNYRLGALGFLAHPGLTLDSPYGASGNYGLLDVLSALKWVQRNAKAFGGDPTHVMLFGESHGALDTCALLASPLAKGLFSSATIESWSCDVPTIGVRYTQGDSLVKAVGCSGVPDVAACLRAVPVDQIMQKSGSGATSILGWFRSALSKPVDSSVGDFPWGAAVDGYVLPDTPLHLIAQGKHNPMPVVVGTNSTEASILSPIIPIMPTCAQYSSQQATNFGPLASQVEALYPCNPFDLLTPPLEHEIQIITDVVFTCPARRTLRALAAGQTESTFRYYFTHRYSGLLGILGAFHGAELPFVFDHLNQVSLLVVPIPYWPTPDETALAKWMGGYWRTFAATGNPNFPAAPLWPVYDPHEDDTLQLDVAPSALQGLHSTQCDFWDANGI
jgi:para-nitrobenzyl esterase